MISVSYSRLSTFERCAFRAKLAYVDKIPEPPFPEGQESPLDRGSRIHLMAEQYVSGQLDSLPPELSKLRDAMDSLQRLYQDGKLQLEQTWCFNDAWVEVPETDFANTWLRIKADAVQPDPYLPWIVEYKTGKRSGNEVKHHDQVLLYALGALHRFPELEMVYVTIYYLDQGETVNHQFTEPELRRRFLAYNERLLKLGREVVFAPRPNVIVCRYCPYKTGPIGKNGQVGTGDCIVNPV